MKSGGFSFFIASVITFLAVTEMAAQTSTPIPVPPTLLQILQFLSDRIDIDIVALALAIIGFLSEELGRVRCWVR